MADSGAGAGAGTGAGAGPARTRMEPPIGPESGPFWEATRTGTLLVQWCTACDKAIFYPRSICPGCGGSEAGDDPVLQWRAASGRATVYAAGVEHNPAATGSTFSDGEPYAVALVELEEGVRMLTNVIGCPADDVKVGLAVKVTWEPLSDGRQLPLFMPATGTDAAK